ncbi:MAG: DUF1295 domain-containing protein [Bryobacter sp.]
MTPFPVEQLLSSGSLAVLFCTVLMALVWLLHLPLKNAAVVDVAWPLGILGAAMIYLGQGTAALEKRVLLGAMVTLWALRLSLYLLVARVWGKPEEGRYVKLREEFGTNAATRFFVFYQLQAASCVVLALPMFFAAHAPGEGLSTWEKSVAGLFLLAMCGEWMADRQLSQFKDNAANHGKVCREGLWAWSRHPNYFFEWMIWMSFALYGFPYPWAILGLVAPALIYYFVNFVTGIPPTEAQALRSKGEAYRAYQQEVSAFFPLPPKAQAAGTEAAREE